MIFNLFKSKPSLRELIPDGFVDIHSHILPGIDDGAKNVKESLVLISEMKKLGFSKIIGTPHSYPGLYNNTNDSIKRSFEKISKKINSEIKLNYASEYMIDDSLISKSENKDLLCLKDNLVLIETSFDHLPLNLFEVIFYLQTNGYLPVIAHPERYRYMYDNKHFYKLADRGCKFQLNLLSAVGYYGEKCANITDFLLKNNLADFAGSDLHNLAQIRFFDNKIKIKQKLKFSEILENNLKFFS